MQPTFENFVPTWWIWRYAKLQAGIPKRDQAFILQRLGEVLLALAAYYYKVASSVAIRRLNFTAGIQTDDLYSEYLSGGSRLGRVSC